MINEFVHEYTRHIRLPTDIRNEEWVLGPLTFEQYVVALLIAKFNNFKWFSGHSPLEWEPVFPIAKDQFIHKDLRTLHYVFFKTKRISVGSFPPYTPHVSIYEVDHVKLITLPELLEDFNDY